MSRRIKVPKSDWTKLFRNVLVCSLKIFLRNQPLQSIISEFEQLNVCNKKRENITNFYAKHFHNFFQERSIVTEAPRVNTATAITASANTVMDPLATDIATKERFQLKS